MLTHPKSTRVHELGGHGVDVRLFTTATYPSVLWHKGNSYVACHVTSRPTWLVDGIGVELFSVNGIGEIRWSVDAHSPERDVVAKHFGATLAPREAP